MAKTTINFHFISTKKMLFFSDHKFVDFSMQGTNVLGYSYRTELSARLFLPESKIKGTYDLDDRATSIINAHLILTTFRDVWT